MSSFHRAHVQFEKATPNAAHTIVVKGRTKSGLLFASEMVSQWPQYYAFDWIEQNWCQILLNLLTALDS
jgi:hypothetical protein